jgi:hypothetical protein
MAEQTHSADWNAEAPQSGRPARSGLRAPAGAQASTGMPAPFGMQALWRLAIWGSLAIFALFAAVISAYSTASSQRPTAAVTSGQKPAGQGSSGQTRVSQATSGQATSEQANSGQAASGQATSNQATSGQGSTPPQVSAVDLAPRPDETAAETKRLAEAVRALAADRELVLARIAALERNLDGVTGSIKRDRVAGLQPNPPPTPALSPPPIPPIAAAPAARPDTPAAPVTEVAPAQASTQAPIPVPAPVPQPSGTSDAAQKAAPDAGNRWAPSTPLVRVTAVEPAEAPAEPMVAGGLGVDVGGATNYEGLRTLWRSTKNSDPTLLEELFPVVAIRENNKTHAVDLRLVVGPVADAEAAARLCTTLSAAHHYCQPVAFEGQRLALNDPVPAKTPLTPASRHRPVSSSPAKLEPETPHFQAVIGK